MKAFVKFGIVVALCIGYPLQVFSQSVKPGIQQADNCSVNVSGNGSPVTLTCTGVDPKLAEQVRAILNSSRRNETNAKNISAKLDLTIAEYKIVSYGNLKQRCADMAFVISNFATKRENMVKDFPAIQFTEETYRGWQEGNSQRFYEYLLVMERLQKDLAKHDIVDEDLDERLKTLQEWSDATVKYPNANNHYLTAIEDIRRVADIFAKISYEIPQ
jgi:hypothetical protein